MSFSESVKLGLASWDHTISNFRIWIVAALPILALDVVYQAVTLIDPFGVGQGEFTMYLAWVAIAAVANVYLLLPVAAEWHARNLIDSPPEPIPIRLTWTRREWRYFRKLLLAFLAILLMFFVVGLLTAFSDGDSLGAQIFGTVVMICGLWLVFAFTSRLWMSLGAVLSDPPVTPADVVPKIVATVLCAALAPAFVLGTVAQAFDGVWPSLIVALINGTFVSLAVVAALGALQRRCPTPPSSATS